MADRNQGTPTRATAAGTPLSPQSAKSTGRRRGSQQARRNAEPLASIPSNIPEQDPGASQGTASKSVGNAGPAPSDSNARAPSPGGIAPMASDLPSLDDGAHTGSLAQDMEVDGGAPSVGAGAASGRATPVPTSNGTGTGTLPATPGAGLLRTPLSAARPEFGGPRGGSQNMTSGALDDTTRIWGTNVLVAAAKDQVRRFFLHFIDAEPATPMAGDDGMPEQSPYMRLLQHVVTERLPFINIKASDVANYDPQLYLHTIQYPVDMIMIWDEVVAELGAQEAAELDMEMDPLQVRFHSLMASEVKPIRDLDPLHMDTLVAVKGMVTRTSTIIPDLRVAQFRCEQCHGEATVTVDNGTITEPNQCTSCSKKHTMRLMPNRCAYLNRQVIKMQEDPSTVPEGETPRSLTLYAFDTNVDAAKPGDKVTMTGIFRASRMRVNPRQRALHALFKTYLDVVHIATSSAATSLFKSPEEREDANRARTRQSQGAGRGSAGANADGGGTQAGESQGEVTASQMEGLGTGTPDDPLTDVFAGDLSYEEAAGKEARFRALAADPDIYQKLINSVAPKVIAMDGVKKGLLCQLFGGVSKQVNGKALVRGEINILLVGDPSVSKSQLLGFVHHVAPRGIYTSGKGSSAVGLTAYVTKDPDSGEMVLESGALVLSDRGICCIDEFDKMSDGARAMLHEVMEQQTVSVAKAGLVSQLNARTSILAGANPKESRYNRDMGIAENINLPPTLLSRFDLIYLLLDNRSDAHDWSLGRHLVSLFYPEIPQSATPPISMQELREYIAYARARCAPRFNDEAAAELVERYKKLRSQGRLQQVVVATPRQLEALIRISEALARMQLREVITPSDVEEAYKLWFDAMSSSAANESGQLDMDVLNSGVSADMRRFLAEALPGIMRDILNGMFRSGRTSVQADDLHRAYMEQLTAAGDGAHAEGIKRINKKQMMSALLQIPDVCDIRGDLISKRQ